MNATADSAKAVVVFVLLVSFLVACSSSPPTATPLPTPFPTATLRPATDFTDGAYELPHGKVLFVEVVDSKIYPESQEQQNTTQSPYCILGEVPELSCEGEYWWYQGVRLELWEWDPQFKLGSVLVGYQTHCYVAMGGGPFKCDCRYVEASESLPFFATRGKRIAINAVNAQGAAVVEIDGNTMWLEPGQSIESVWRATGDQDCVLHIETLTNHGILDEQQIEVH